MNCDDTVIRAAIQGNMEAFRRIVESYQSIVFMLCYNILRDHQEAENAAQDTFLQVYKSLDKYEFKGFRTWIGRIAANKAIDIKRRSSRQKRFESLPFDENLLTDYGGRISMDEELMENEDNERLSQLCSRLPEKYCKVIHKYYIQTKTYEEIAAEEGISIKTVESRLYRAKKMLREKWEEG